MAASLESLTQSGEMVSVEIDPNRVSHRFPQWFPINQLRDCDGAIAEGDTVEVVQPYKDEPDYVSTGVVMKVEGLNAWLDVDWDGFHDRPAGPDV